MDDVRAVGAIVRIVAVGADGAPIHIEVTREEYQRLDVSKGQAGAPPAEGGEGVSGRAALTCCCCGNLTASPPARLR